jgi:CBS domain-containing protein
MNRITVFVSPEDPIAKAASLMALNGVSLLPVLDGKRKIAGVIRIRDVFDELSNGLLE